MCACVRRTHLARALGAVVHGPLVAVLAHDAVVDAHAVVDADAVPDQLVLVRLDLACEETTKEKHVLVPG